MLENHKLSDAELLKIRRGKEIATIKAKNEMLNNVRDDVIERYKDNPEKLHTLLVDIDKAIENNQKMGEEIYGATNEEIENAKYSMPTSSAIKDYEEHLKKRGIEDDSVLYQKNLEETIGTDVVQNVLSKEIENEEEDGLERLEMPNIGEIPTIETTSTTNGVINTVKVEEINNGTDILDLDIPSNISYDIIPLPSKGECYPSKKDRLPVSYLTASDENVIISPNLYRDGKVLDIILNRKILDKTIKPLDLINGDREAILLWLRATGYGVDFPVNIRDPKTGEVFDTVVQLDKFKMKDFTLKGDKNGWFEYQTDSGDKIKFKYLTKREENDVIKRTIKNDKSYRKARLYDLYNDLYDELDGDSELSEKNKNKLNKAITVIKDWHDLIDANPNLNEYSLSVTEGMIAKTMSVNGNTDKGFIRNYIENMRALDSRNYRNFMNENEPGMDLTFEAKRPESLGGGSFTTFLELDSFLFINIA